MIRFLSAAVAALFVTSFAYADNEFAFEDYSVRIHDVENRVIPLLTPEDIGWHHRQEIWEAAATEVADFGSHFILLEFGSGIESWFGVLVDPTTGDLYPLPFSSWAYDHRRGSNLLVVNPDVGNRPSRLATEYYVWTGERFEHIYTEQTHEASPQEQSEHTLNLPNRVDLSLFKKSGDD